MISSDISKNNSKQIINHKYPNSNLQSPILDSDIAISIKNLSKKYQLYETPKHRLKEVLHPFRKKYHHDFWALRDVSFTVKRGETLGIIGSNGAGKSTLLQIICGTMMPTHGEVEVNGRVAALLGLGAGFNPEFTGKENVYMNAAMIGLSSQEIEARFEDITSFADIGDFIDQPVKTYSSGMFLRLAFSVAISGEPEILVVDEILAVGDEAFQRKCFGRLETIKEGGSSIVIVSHSAPTIVELCDRALLLDRGEPLMLSRPKEVEDRYHQMIYAPHDRMEKMRNEILNISVNKDAQSGKTEKEKPKEKRAFYEPNLIPESTVHYISRGASITDPVITTMDGKQVNILTLRDEYIFSYCVRFSQPAYRVRFGTVIKTIKGVELGGSITYSSVDAIDFVEEGSLYRVELIFKLLVTDGTYFMNAGVVGQIESEEAYIARVIDIIMFKVQHEENSLVTGPVDFYFKPSVIKIEEN